LLVATGFSQSISTEAPSVSASAVTMPKGFLQGELSGGFGIDNEFDTTLISSSEAPFLLLRYGLTDRFELRLQNHTSLSKLGDQFNYRLRQIGIGAKYAILPNDGNTNLAVIGTFSPRTANTWDAQQYDLTLAFSQSIGDNGSLGVNSGYGLFNSSAFGKEIVWRNHSIPASIVYSHQFFDRLTAFGEFYNSYGRSNFAGFKSQGTNYGIDFGLQFLLTERIQIDWASGFNLNYRSQFHSIGLNIYFDTNKK